MDGTYDRNNRPDLAAYWMPFTANRQFKANPRLLVSAAGMYYRDEDGHESSTAPRASGAATRPCPRRSPRRFPPVDDADYAPSFQMGHPFFDFATAVARSRRGLGRCSS